MKAAKESAEALARDHESALQAANQAKAAADEHLKKEEAARIEAERIALMEKAAREAAEQRAAKIEVARTETNAKFAAVQKQIQELEL